MAEVEKITEKEVINIDEKDIERVNKFRSDFAEVTARIGEIEVERLNAQMILKNIEEAKENLSEQFKSMRNEVQITSDFKEKYGNGEFDIENGTFTPIA
jgi:peptide deformylase